MPFSLQATLAGVTSSWQSLRLGEAPRGRPTAQAKPLGTAHVFVCPRVRHGPREAVPW